MIERFEKWLREMLTADHESRDAVNQERIADWTSDAE
jgi:hypothetical protein